MRTNKKQKVVKRGEVWTAKLDPCEGSEQKGIRPVVILQNNVGNVFSNTTIIAVLSSQEKTAALPTHLKVSHEKLKTESTILLEQIKTIDKKRLGKKLFDLTKDETNQLNRCISTSLGI